MRWITKKLTVPETNGTREVEAIQLWEVRWKGRYGPYSCDTRPEVEAFPTEDAAREFAESLKNAFKLIRHYALNEVSVGRAR